jgi:DNA polymerase III epsilon subunit-like protein
MIMYPELYNRAITSARLLVENPDTVVFDTETTGFDVLAEIVEISAISAKTGEVLLNTLVKPSKPISQEASQVNNITNEMVSDALPLSVIGNRLKMVFGGKLWTAYNAPFDARLFYQSCQISGLKFAPAFYAVVDAMQIVSDVLQIPGKYGGFKWVKLGEAASIMQINCDEELHRALADTVLLRNVLLKVASLDLL